MFKSVTVVQGLVITKSADLIETRCNQAYSSPASLAYSHDSAIVRFNFGNIAFLDNH